MARMKWHVISLDSTASTNADAVRLAGEGAAEGTVVVARTQTAGRGRQGRAWVSRPGAGLYFSAILRPHAEPEAAATLPLVAGLAVAEAVAPLLPSREVKIKWPNDVLVGGRKLAGILCEMQTGESGVAHVVVGIGVNVNLAESELPPDVAAVATSLSQAAGRAFALDAVLDAVLGSLGDAYDAWRRGGLAALLPRIGARDALRGRHVRIGLVGEPVEGVADGIAPSGALLLRKPDGGVEALFSGEAHIGVNGGAAASPCRTGSHAGGSAQAADR